MAAKRKGKRAPVVAKAQAEFAGNVIRGSGVAGIRTEGMIRVVGNTFECPTLKKGGGPPQFAVWGLPGSDIVFLENKVTGWRHALSADKAAVVASYNQVADYWQVCFRISQAPAPVTAIGNRFWSELGHPGITINGNTGIVEDNHVEKKK